MTIEVCHTYRGVHIPGCMGCAAGGHKQCTCPSPKDRLRDLERRLAEVERRLGVLEGEHWRAHPPGATGAR